MLTQLPWSSTVRWLGNFEVLHKVCTSTILECSLLVLSLNSEWLREVSDAVICPSCGIEYKDWTTLPYAKAVLQETVCYQQHEWTQGFWGSRTSHCKASLSLRSLNATELWVQPLDEAKSGITSSVYILSQAAKLAKGEFEQLTRNSSLGIGCWMLSTCYMNKPVLSFPLLLQRCYFYHFTIQDFKSQVSV